VVATCCRRRGAVLALAFERGGPDGTATLNLTVEVEPRLRRGLVDRLAALVDVVEVLQGRPGTVPRWGAPLSVGVVHP
jgi:hypothetical protein